MLEKESRKIEVKNNLKYLRDFLDKIENLLDNEKEDLDVIVPLILTQKLMHDIHYGEFNYEFVKNLLNNLE